MFELQLLEPIKMIRDDSDPGGRRYLTPDRRYYPSVTTILSRNPEKKAALDKWRARVGTDEANKITRKANVRGTAIHTICEKYVSNDPQYLDGVNPVNIDTFNQIKPHLDQHVTEVYGIELPLYSDLLKTAGTADLVCKWDGTPSIVDFKTARWKKPEEMINDYFLQATCYSIMAQGIYKLLVPQIVVIIAIDNDRAAIYVKKRIEYADQVKRVFITDRTDYNAY
jgi:genome maintenance exonuclease 1